MAKQTRSKSHYSAKQSINFYSVHPWESRHYNDHSEIIAYVEVSENWESVLTVHTTSGKGHETTAEFILAIIHEHQRKQGVLKDALDALELCLEEDGLTFSSEQAAERAVAKIKRVI